MASFCHFSCSAGFDFVGQPAGNAGFWSQISLCVVSERCNQHEAPFMIPARIPARRTPPPFLFTPNNIWGARIFFVFPNHNEVNYSWTVIVRDQADYG